MKAAFAKGSESVILTVFTQDSSLTTGAGLGSLDENSGIVGGYVRMGSTGVALAVDEDVATEGTYQTPSTTAHVRIGTPANMRTGTYELHFHNDLFADGADMLTITLGGASNMADIAIEIQLTDLDLNNATPNANVTQIGGAAQSATDFKDLVDTGYDPVAHKIQGVVTTDTATAATDVTNAVKISAGTGAGQLDFTSGVVKANLAQILGTALTETAGYLAAGFKKFFNVATPTGTVNSLPDAAPDAAGGLPISDAGGLDMDNILAAIVSGFPTNEHADVEPGGGSIVTGTNTANDSDSTWLDDGAYWQIEPTTAVGGFGLNVVQTFTLGTSLKASLITINAKESMGGVVHVWAYNYLTAAWDQLSDTVTAIQGAVDDRFSFSLLRDHQQASDGEVQIRYTSTTTTTGKYLWLDQVLISAVAVSGLTAADIAEAVWANRYGHDVSRHTSRYTGKVYYVDGTDGLDTNPGDYAHGAFKTIAYAISATAAGDRIIVKAGTYDEGTLDMAVDALELVCEYGTTITHSGSDAQTLLVSGNSCVISNCTITDAGRIGIKVTGTNVKIDNVISGPSNTIGFECTGSGARLERCFVSTPTVAAYKMSGAARKMFECLTIGNAATVGFWHLTGALGICENCHSNGHTSNGWQVDAGANYIMIVGCSSGASDGAVLDNGTSTVFRRFSDAATDDANLTQILNTALTETSAGYLAAAFKKFLDVASPVFTAASPNVPSSNLGDYKATGFSTQDRKSVV